MDTDAERIERLRELWAKWRFHIVIGLSMALAAVGGFSWENLTRQAERRAANEALFRVLQAARDDRAEEAEAAFEELHSASYPDLRHLGAFAVAEQRALAEDHDGAESILREVMDNSEDDGLRDLAVLRLSEALIGRGDFAEAEELLTQRAPNQGAARILFQDRLGDAAALRGDSDAALAAYQQAENQARRDFPGYIPLLEFKIGALLAGVDESGAGSESGIELESGIESESGVELESGIESESDAELESEMESEADAESGTESISTNDDADDAEADSQ